MSRRCTGRHEAGAWRWVLVWAALVTPAGAGAAPKTAVLPVEGTAALAGQLNRALGRALAERGVKDTLGPLETRARMTQDRLIAAGLARAKKTLGQAREQLLQMKRGEAVRLARQSAAEAARVDARFADPALLARARGVLALALLLRPADEAGARQTFQNALALDSAFTSDPDHTPPRAARLLVQARKQPPAPVAPRGSDVQGMYGRLPLSQMVWLAAVSRQGKVRLEVVVFDAPRGKVLAHLHGGATAQRLVVQAAALIKRGLQDPASKPARAFLPASQPNTRGATPPARPAAPAVASSPWYKKWWVWTIVGVAVVGTGVGLGVGLSQSGGDPPSGFDFQFNFGG